MFNSLRSFAGGAPPVHGWMMSFHAISRYLPCVACVPIRVQGGRRAVAVLREASRPNRLFYSHRSRDAGGESRESTFVQREEGCGEILGYARLASRHQRKAQTRVLDFAAHFFITMASSALSPELVCGHMLVQVDILEKAVN